jgi:hypothetical protein
VADPPPFAPTGADLENLPLIGDRRAAPALRESGLTVLGLANNHALDAGPEGLAVTRDALRAAGITAVGAGVGPAAARAPQIRVVHGLRVAVLARSTVPSNQHRAAVGVPGGEQPALLDPARPTDLATLAADLAQARAGADVVILLLHWGVEYRATVQESQRRVAAVAAEAGVDLVVGAHSHMAAPVELLGARPTVVAWSLGNAVFDQQGRPEVREGLALDARFDRRGLADLRVRPLWRQGVQPRLVSPADPRGQAVLARTQPASAAKLHAAVMQYTGGGSRDYALFPALAYRRPGLPSLPPGRATDLDRDGTVERITLRQDQLVVQQTTGRPGEATVLWRTPATWRVEAFDLVSAAQPDLAFTVWKETGRTEMYAEELRDEIRQHFFLFGWRRGAIRPVWNGSALPAPFRAFAFAPVGLGGANRLVALEGDYAAPERPPRLAVWAWNGFGYILEWRSADLPGVQTLWRDGDTVWVR